jgi:ribose transport system substrate-binding protein
VLGLPDLHRLDFVEQGERAAAQMIEATGGTGKVAILLGSSGNNVTTDRNDGFLKGIEGSELEVVAEQTGNFNRQEGRASPSSSCSRTRT